MPLYFVLKTSENIHLSRRAHFLSCYLPSLYAAAAAVCVCVVQKLVSDVLISEMLL